MLLRLSLYLLVFIYTVKSENATEKHEGFCHEINTQSKSVVCYYAGFISPDKLDPCLCTHLLLTDWRIGADLKQLSHKRYRDLDFVKELKKQNPNLQVGLVLSGNPQDSVWAELIARNKQASALAFRAVAFLSEMDLDGIAIDYDPSSVERKNNFTALMRSFREAFDLSTDSSSRRWLMVNVARDFNHIRQAYDFALLSKLVDYFYLPAYNFTDENSEEIIHPSPLMGSDGENADSLVDLLLSLNATSKKIILGLPAFGVFYHLEENSTDLVIDGERAFVPYQQICKVLKTGDWIVERAEDKTETRALGNLTWVGYDDSASIRIKSKYSLLRNLGGVGVWYLDHDDFNNTCGEGTFPLVRAAHIIFDELNNADQTRIMRSFEQDIDFEEAEAQLSQIAIPRTGRANGGPFRITRIVDRTGQIHFIQDPSQTNLVCTRPGYYRVPEDCSRFYRCVKFNQFKDDFVIFEYDCPGGLVFDEKWEVCNWPSATAPCGGSTEIMPVPRNKFICPNEGYFTDPENCRWFYKCDDFLRDGALTAFEFRCPFDLAFDEANIMCNWRWLVPGCGDSGFVRPPIGPFSSGSGERPGHSLETDGRPLPSQRPGHNIDGPLTGNKDRTYPNGPNGPDGPFPDGPAGPDGPFPDGPAGPNGPFPTGPNGPFPTGPAGSDGPYPEGPAGPGPNGFDGSPRPNGFGGSLAPNGFGGSPGPNGFGGSPNPNGFGASPGPNGFGASPGPNGFGGSPGPNGFGGSPGPNGFGGSLGPNGFGGSPGPNGFGNSVGPNGLGSSVGPNGLGSSVGPNGLGSSVGPNGFGGSRRPNGIVGSPGPNGLGGSPGPNTFGSTASNGFGGSQRPNGLPGSNGFGVSPSPGGFNKSPRPNIITETQVPGFDGSLQPGSLPDRFSPDISVRPVGPGGSSGSTQPFRPQSTRRPAVSIRPNGIASPIGPDVFPGPIGPHDGSFTSQFTLQPTQQPTFPQPNDNGGTGQFGPGSFGSRGSTGFPDTRRPNGITDTSPGLGDGPSSSGGFAGSPDVSRGPFPSNGNTGTFRPTRPHSFSTPQPPFNPTSTLRIRPPVITARPHTDSTNGNNGDFGPHSPREFPNAPWEPRQSSRRPNAIEDLPIGYIPGRIVGNTQCEKTISVVGDGDSYGQIHVKPSGFPNLHNEYEFNARFPNAFTGDGSHVTGGPSRQTDFTNFNKNRGGRHFTSQYQNGGIDQGQVVVRTKWSETTGKTGLTDGFLNDQKNFGFTSQFNEHISVQNGGQGKTEEFHQTENIRGGGQWNNENPKNTNNINFGSKRVSAEKSSINAGNRLQNHKFSSQTEFDAVNSWTETSVNGKTNNQDSTTVSQQQNWQEQTEKWSNNGKTQIPSNQFTSRRQGNRDINEEAVNNFVSTTPLPFDDLAQHIGSVNRGFTRGPTVLLEEDNGNRIANEERLSIRWQNVTALVGPVECNRAGLFRHPDDCSLFYECYWDRWLNKFTIHYFECPVRLAFDFRISGCNWPLKGPQCEHN